jgi:hypothetical protein
MLFTWILWRLILGLLFTWSFMAYGFRSVVHLKFYGVWFQVCCSLEVVWPYGLRYVVHLRFYSVWFQVSCSLEVSWPYGFRSVVHLRFYGRMVSGMLFTWGFMAVWSQVCSLEVLWPYGQMVCCSLDVLWTYGLGSVVHLWFYGRMVSGLLFTWGFMAYSYRFIVHLMFYGVWL